MLFGQKVLNSHLRAAILSLPIIDSFHWFLQQSVDSLKVIQKWVTKEPENKTFKGK